MTRIIRRMPRKRWHYPMIILLMFFAFGCYLINMKNVSAKNSSTTDSHFELADVTSGELNLLTYNIAGLPELISSAELPRAKSISLIGQRLNRFDLVNIQEDFNYNTDLYRLNHHPFRTKAKGKVPFGDGLSTLSRYPILDMQRIPWNHCNGTDCLTPKGFAYMRVQIAKNVVIDVYNLHATSSYASSGAVRARCENMKQLAVFIKKHSEGMPLLVMGDFNAHYVHVGDNIHYFRKATQTEDPWVSLTLAGQIPQPRADFLDQDILTVTNDLESIDKIMYRNSKNIRFTPRHYSVEGTLFSSDGTPLSDHLPVSLRIEWQYLEGTSTHAQFFAAAASPKVHMK